jgi:hypothetical protein
MSNKVQTPYSNKLKYSINNTKLTSDKCVGTSNHLTLKNTLLKNGVINESDKICSNF